MPKSYPGKPPEGEGWTIHPEVLDHAPDQTQWRIATLSKDFESKWVTFKVFAVGRVPHKGNYSLAWNNDESGFARSREALALITYRPQLESTILDHLEAWWLRQLAFRREARSLL